MKKIAFIFALILLWNCKEQPKNNSTETQIAPQAEKVEIFHILVHFSENTWNHYEILVRIQAFGSENPRIW